jgi:dihydroflavonol-4-reductase
MAMTVLVTGASGFIGGHCVLDLLNQGFNVVGSVRDLERSASMETILQKRGADTSRLKWVAANLTDADSWLPAVKGCDAVFHVASPVPTIQPRDPLEVIEPAIDGTVSVLKACAAMSVKRVILTSSVAAILGVRPESRIFTGSDWSDPEDPEMIPYTISKTLAERAAWDFCDSNNIALTTIHPALVLGPTLEKDYGSSLEAIVKLMNRDVPLLPKFGFEIVDVRDVASLHRLALQNPTTKGQRLIAANGFLWFREIARILNEAYPDRRIPEHEMPNWLSKVASLFVREIGSFINDLDVVKQLDNTPALALGWHPREPKLAILDGAKSLIEVGTV